MPFRLLFMSYALVKHLGYATARYISAIVEQEKASIEKSEHSKNQDGNKGEWSRTSSTKTAIPAWMVT